MAETVKISYVAGLYRVRAELTRALALESETPPADLSARAKAKLESVKQTGEIAFFAIFETRLQELWKALRTSEKIGDGKINFTLGAGCPPMMGIKVEKPSTEKAIATISIDVSKETAMAWRYEWFKLYIWKKLRELGTKEQPNTAQLFSLFTRARSGEKISRLALGSLAAIPPLTKAFAVVANKARQEIAVIVRHPEEVENAAVKDSIFNLVGAAAKQLSKNPSDLKLLKKDVTTALQSALEGPERLGYDLPMVLLAAWGPNAAQTAKEVQTKPRAKAIELAYPGMGKISFTVPPDKTEAIITGFSLDYYDDPTFSVDLDWIKNELKRNQLNSDLPTDLTQALSDAIRKREHLDGKQAARADLGAPNREPYLHKSWQDAASRSAGSDLDADQLDIREMQQRSTVKSGQLVALIKYKKPGRTGRDVYGEDLPQPPDDQIIVQVGEGIVQKEGGRFYASEDGIPSINGNSISLAKMLLHEGDVNLRSGNIRFEGTVEIKGVIDNGSIVETAGDLIVHGGIRGAVVRVQGNLVVRAGGIVTGDKGLVQVKGNIEVDFVENSQILCGGDMKVAKACIGGKIIVGSVLKLGKEGVLAGGRINVRDTIRAGTIGFKNGAPTTIVAGLDWRIARSIEIRRGRLEKVEKKLSEDRLALRELVQRKAQQMTQKHKDLKDNLQDRLQRGRVITEKLEASLAAAKANMAYNPEARVYVEAILHANVSIEMAGQPVAVNNDVASVVILSKRRRGSFIVAIDDILAEDAKNQMNQAS